MAFPRRSSRSPRSRYTLALLLLTAITVLVLDLPGTGPLDPVRGGLAAAFRPVRAAGNAVFRPLSNGWKGAFNYGDLEDQNEELKRQVAEQQGEEAELAQLRQEVADLQKLNGIVIEDEVSIAAEVTSGPLSSFEQTVEISVGSSDGVKDGMAVVTAGGVLGRVTDVASGSSTVELITESSVAIGVRLADDIGVAHGQGSNNPLRVERINDATEVEEGDFVYTSGIDRSAFPAGVAVGVVSTINESVDGIPRTFELEPSADLTSRYVRVVLREAP